MLPGLFVIAENINTATIPRIEGIVRVLGKEIEGVLEDFVFYGPINVGDELGIV